MLEISYHVMGVCKASKNCVNITLVIYAVYSITSTLWHHSLYVNNKQNPPPTLDSKEHCWLVGSHHNPYPAQFSLYVKPGIK